MNFFVAGRAGWHWLSEAPPVFRRSDRLPAAVGLANENEVIELEKRLVLNSVELSWVNANWKERTGWKPILQADTG